MHRTHQKGGGGVSAPEDGAVSSMDWLVLALILVLALGLRVATLNGPLWYDEIITVETHLSLPWSKMITDYQMNHHYLFSFQAKVFTDLFGTENWAIRMPSLIFGLAGIAAMWVLARDVAGVAVAHLTALLLALSFHHIWFSTNARGYAELQFWSTLGMIFWLRGIAEPRLGIWLGYGLVLALAVYTHLTGAFFFFAQGVIWVLVVGWAAIRGRLSRAVLVNPALGYLAGGVIAALLYAPLVPSMLETIGGVSQSSAEDLMKEYQNPIWTVIEAVRTGIGGLGPVVGLIAAAVVVLVLLGCWRANAREPLFGVVTLGHIVITMALLVAIGMRIWPRFFYVDIGFLMLLIVLGVRQSIEIFVRLIPVAVSRELLFQAAAVAMILVSAGLAARNYLAPKQDYDGAVAFVEETQGDGDRVYAVGVAQEIFLGHYATGWGAIHDDPDLEAAVSKPGVVWLVVAFPSRSFRDVGNLEAVVDNGFELVAEKPGTLGDGVILIYRRG